MSITSIGVAATIILTLALATVTMAADPFVGTWKLNLAKSKFSPGEAPKSEIVKIEARENGQAIVADLVTAEGKAIHEEYAPKFDGKGYPAIGDPNADTYAEKKIDANTIDSVWKKNGKVMQTARFVVSKDGKSITGTVKGKNAKGEDITSIAVFDKQ